MTRTSDTSPIDDLRLARPQVRRFWSHAVLFAACVLLANGLVGERGLTETLRARRTFAEAARDLARLRQQNAALRNSARNLRTDPGAIEAAAREELGLIRPGEILVTIRDARTAR
jgi:cell division protein FtsB